MYLIFAQQKDLERASVSSVSGLLNGEGCCLSSSSGGVAALG
jgi:hypothetical protein